VERERREAFFRVVRPLAEARHLAERARRDRDHVGRGESIRRFGRALGERSERFGRHQIRTPRRADDALDAVTHLLLFAELGEALLLELLEVVADLLPRHVERARDARRGLRLGEHLEDARPKRTKEDGGVSHFPHSIRKIYLVKENYFVG